MMKRNTKSLSLGGRKSVTPQMISALSKPMKAIGMLTLLAVIGNIVKLHYKVSSDLDSPRKKTNHDNFTLPSSSTEDSSSNAPTTQEGASGTNNKAVNAVIHVGPHKTGSSAIQHFSKVLHGIQPCSDTTVSSDVTSAPETIWRYNEALSRLAKLKAASISEVSLCRNASLEIGWRQPEDLVPHLIGNKCEPWWVRDVIFLIHHLILPDWKVLEWGGGSSTVWLANHAESVTTIEDSGEWVHDLGIILQQNNISNVELRHRDRQSKGILHSASRGCCYDNYVLGASDMPNSTFDLVSVDGRAREHCLKEAVRLVKSTGGVLVLDNCNRERYQEAIKHTIPQGWLRHTTNLLKEYSVTDKQRDWIIRDDLFTAFWITR